MAFEFPGSQNKNVRRVIWGNNPCVQVEVSQGGQCVSQGGTPGLDPRACPGWRRDPPSCPVAKPVPPAWFLRHPPSGSRGSIGEPLGEQPARAQGRCKVGALSSHTGRGSRCSHRTFPAYGISGLSFESRWRTRDRRICSLTKPGRPAHYVSNLLELVIYEPVY